MILSQMYPPKDWQGSIDVLLYDNGQVGSDGQWCTVSASQQNKNKNHLSLKRKVKGPIKIVRKIERKTWLTRLRNTELKSVSLPNPVEFGGIKLLILMKLFGEVL